MINTITFYIIETLKYYLAYYVCFSDKGRRYWIAGVGGILYCFLALTGRCGDAYMQEICMHIFVMVSMVFWIEGKWIVKIERLIILFFSVNCLAECFEAIGEIFQMRGANGSARAMYISGLVLGTLAIVALIKHQIDERQKDKIRVAMQKCIFLLAVLVAIGMLLTVAGLDVAREYIKNVRFQVMAITLSVISYSGIGVLMLFALYIRNADEQMKQIVENEILLKNMQKHYYEALLKREADTRRYRHDMVNHLICLRNLAEEGKVENLKEYLIQMQGDVIKLQKKCPASGNQILDALTNYYLAMLEENTCIKLIGRADVTVDERMLCIIYSNLLKNAVEEILKIPKEQKAILEISFSQGKRCFRITIKNSLRISRRGNTVEEILKTQKRDKQNHGFGISNAIEAAAEVGGKIELKTEGEIFIAVATMKVGK